jgi:uncharacterized protein (DUF1501 family)
MFERTTETARIDATGCVTRRSFVHSLSIAGAAGLAGLSWRDRVLADAPALQKQGKAVILLWMQGGPSQLETFDPKTKSDVKGDVNPIATAADGIQISEFFPNVAKQMKDISLIRSVTNKEGAHPRATYQLHTGYAPSGAIKHPTLGSLIAKELAPEEFDLPSFVSVLGPSESQGFLPVKYAPFRVGDPSRMPANAEAMTKGERFERRLRLMNDLDQTYAKTGSAALVENHRGLYESASRLIKSPRLKAFDVNQESAKTVERYGTSAFGKGCLLARRLVETGVTFVEVQLGNWDTHDDNHNRCKTLAGQCDPAFAALVADLKERGRLDNTLVVWMGEFGRTPKINGRGGRDHFPRAFNVALAGCGVKGGRVIGKTTDDGQSVADRPVSVPDLFCTFTHALGVNPAKENQSGVGRPIKIVDGGSPVKELFG